MSEIFLIIKVKALFALFTIGGVGGGGGDGGQTVLLILNFHWEELESQTFVIVYTIGHVFKTYSFFLTYFSYDVSNIDFLPVAAVKSIL